MKKPEQHSWMEPDWSSSDPQPRPYGWAYGEDQGDHHVRKHRQMEAALNQKILAMQAARYAASFESTSALPRDMGALQNMPDPMLRRVMLDYYSQDPKLRHRAIDMFAAVGEGVFRGVGWRR